MKVLKKACAFIEQVKGYLGIRAVLGKFGKEREKWLKSI